MKKNYFLFVFSSLLFLACSGDDNNMMDGTPPEMDEMPAPDPISGFTPL